MKKMILAILLILPFMHATQAYADFSSTSDLSPHQKLELTLFYKPWCPYCQKVLKYLEKIHKKIPLKNIDHDPEGKEYLLKVGGKSQVPCLMINQQALYESDRIIEWLDKNQDKLSSI